MKLGFAWWLKYLHYQLGLHIFTALADWSYDLKRYRDSNIMKPRNNNTTCITESKAMKIKLLIRKRRIEKGISQTELASLLGVTQGAVMKWETERCFPSLERTVEMADIFDCKVDDLIYTEKEVKQ